MRKLALSDEILLSIEKPERYIGNEVNMVRKNPSDVDIRFCMCFPDVYEIGMSHLGIQILYDMFNRREDVYCERVYSPWKDLDKVMRENNIPLFAIESQDSIKDFDFLGITLQYEMCYTNVLQVIDLSGIPIMASDRTDDDPIVIGGGPCVYNPEPLSDFFDIFYIGEGETQYYRLFDLYKEHKKNGGSRKEFLELAAEVPGMYVPAFYDVDYNSDGTIKSFIPNNRHAQEKIVKQLVVDMSSTDFDAEYNYYPQKPLVPFIKATQDRVVLEIQRGCIRGCRFCQAGMVYRPVRERNVEFLKELAYRMLHSTGHEEISLSSLSSSDYSKLEELVNYLIDEFHGNGVNISLPSLRIDSFSLDVMSKVQDIRKSSLTFAPEAGSQRLRNVINKGLTEDVILNGASLAFEGGWNRVKLYFMLGLPTETEEDIKGIAELCEKIAEVYYSIPKDQRNGKVQITASSSFFIPKPFTPFQWASMCTKEQFLDKARIVNTRMKEMLNKKSIKYNWHEADVSEMEGLLARGDRKVAKTVLKAYELGCLYDAWSDSFDNDKWRKAIEDTNIDMDFYISRERNVDEIMPWDFIDIGVTKSFLIKEWENAKNELVTPNCRMKCNGCGAAAFGGGVCFEN
ncbi:MAG: TIGR03960 family B12-binding radical SAM protein [Lachnospiraceae bacterium]|nr:TIGR03960 family B12-binding radical SAM protein [Lachnospiraceae bacterium]